MADELKKEDDLSTEMSSNDKIALASIALLSPLLGATFGGKRGGAAGAASGLGAVGGAVQQYGKDQAEEKKAVKAATAAEARRQQGIKDQKDMHTWREGQKTEKDSFRTVGDQIVKLDKDGNVEPIYTAPPSRSQTIASDERTEKKIQALGDDLASSQNVFSAIGTLENQLGFKLDKVDKTGKVDGKTVDLPGMSVPLIGRVSAYDSDARTLEGAVAKIFNTELKDRSGATVVDQELTRLRIEFGAGKYNTEPEMLKALSDYKKAATNALKNHEAKYPPEIRDEYEKRGGFTSNKLKKSEPKTVRIQAPDGTIAEVPAASKQKYLDKGGKLVE